MDRWEGKLLLIYMTTPAQGHLNHNLTKGNTQANVKWPLINIDGANIDLPFYH